MKAALNVEMALALMAKKKTVRSDKEELFRNALGLRLKTGVNDEPFREVNSDELTKKKQPFRVASFHKRFMVRNNQETYISYVT